MRPSYNNSQRITSQKNISRLKLAYYYFLMKWYSTNGYFCDLALCNSSWTYDHIRSMWSCPVKVLYPPCDVSKFLKIPLNSVKQRNAISIGQFRPEKDHYLQILAFSLLLANNSEFADCKLLLVGSCRDQEDDNRVDELALYAKTLKIANNVEFHLNVKFDKLIELLSISSIGLHSM